MSAETTWCCAFCAKQITLPGALSPCVYDSTIPYGWAWAKYDSARCPTRDSRALGCCPDHARMAAENFSVPGGAITFTIQG